MKLSEYLKQNNMTTKDYFEMQNRRAKGKTTLSDYRREKKNSLSQTINFDTFESDLNTMGTTIQKMKNEWQTGETMKNTRSSIEAMQTRIGAYQEYAKMFGGADISDVATSYQTVLDNWDDLSSLYGQFKNADAYKAEQKRIQLSEKFRFPTGRDHQKGETTYRGMTFDEVQAEMKKWSPDSDEYKFLSNYTGYTDLKEFDKAIESASVRIPYTEEEKAQKLSEVEEKYKGSNPKQTMTARRKARENLEKGKVSNQEYLDKLQQARNIWEQDNVFDLYRPEMQNEDFEEKSKYVSTQIEPSFWNQMPIVDDDGKTIMVAFDDYKYEYINNPELRDYISILRTGSPHAGSDFDAAGYAYLTDEETAYYNYLYNTKGKDAAEEFLDAMEVPLTKRAYTERTGQWQTMADNGGFFGGLGLSAASVITNISGAIGNTIAKTKEFFTGEDYNPYDPLRMPGQFTSDTRGYISENIAEATEGMDLWGQNIPSFLYQTGMSVADSAINVAAFGNGASFVLGSSAYQQKAKELFEAGESDDVVRLGALASGLAEAVFEKVSIEKLLKTTDVSSLKKLVVSGLKQAGVEASEETFTEIANILSDTIIRGDSSELAQKYEELKRRGFSEGEITTELAKYVGGQVGWAGIGGFLSGLGMGGFQSVQNYRGNKAKGNEIIANARTDDMLNTARMTPRESAAYKAYTDYAVRNNKDNITPAQLGSIYHATATLAQDKKADPALKLGLNKELAKVNTDNVELKRAKELTKNKDAESVNIQGIKMGDETTIVTPEGEVNLEEMSLNQRDAEIVAYAESMSKEYGDDVANLFIEQYDGQTKVDEFATSFNLVMSYAKHNFTQDVILENKGVLSYDQVKNIYESTVKSTFEEQQKLIDQITERQSKNVFVQGVVNDSIIDYDSNTTDGTKVNWNTLTPKQKKAIKFMQRFAKATGVNIELFKSEIKDGKYQGERGYYDPETNTIGIDVYAGRNYVGQAKATIIPSLSHELTHWMKAKSPAIYESILNDVLAVFDDYSKIKSHERIADEIERMANAKLKRMQKANPDQKVTLEEVKQTISEDDAIDEIVARACEDMLLNGTALKKMLSKMSATEQQTFIDKIKETFENLLRWVNDLIKHSDPADTDEAQFLRNFKDELQTISEKWYSMLSSAIESNQALQSEGIIAEELINGISKDGTTIVGKNNIQMSERTYEEGGREFLENWLNEQSGLTEEDVADILNQTDRIKSLMEDIRENNELPDYARWASMDVIKDENGEKVLSVIVKNGDYAMNIDFSQVCKKRVALNAVLNAMVQSGDLNFYTLSETDVADLNAIIKKHEFEIACALCFVDSKRYRVGSWAESFCEGSEKTKNKKPFHQYGFNEMVRSLIPKGSNIQVDEFNFTNREIVGQPTSNLLFEMDDSELDFTLIDEIMEREYKPDGKSTDLYAYAKAIKEHRELRKILNPAEIISSVGLDAIRLENKELYRLINRHQGTARPKFAHDVVAYGNDILKASNFNKEKARMVGGVRCQSFSDFMANMVFDYVQFISELSAKELTSHSYTKEPLFVKLFGMTGMKINMSLVPKAVEMTPEQQKYFAILNDEKANKRSAEYRQAKRDYAKLTENAGLDENGNYIWEDETFPYDIAMELVVDPRYSANCGTIAVGISDNHILKLLNDENISMVIPYHKSGLNHIVAMMRNIDLYNDYTKIQGTRFANGVKLKNVPDFDFYGDLYGKDGKEGTHDPKKTAENYLKWCDEHNYIPKFEKSRIGRRFRDNPNYYKLLVDFRVYDTDGTYREQQPVKPIYPENEEFKDLLLNGVVDKNGKVYGGLNQQQNTSDKLDAESKQIVEEFKQVLAKKHGKDVLAKKNADRDLAPTFYSQMGKTIDEMKQDKIGATSVVPYLKGRGVKDEEIKWSGIEAFLEGKKSVAKAELQEFVNNSMLQIEEQTSGGNIEDIRAKTDSLTAAIEQAMPYSVDSADMQEYIMGKATEFDRGSITKEELEDDLYETISNVCMDNLAPSDDYGGFFEWQESKEWAKITKAMDDIVRTVTSQTRWNEYILDGGSNYREITFKMPNSTYTNSAMKAHWGDKAKGILAHARIQDFEVNGKKMLFVEEIQSDWHNAGQKYGYGDNAKALEQARLKQAKLKEEYDSYGKQQDELRAKRYREIDDFEYETEMRKLVEKETAVLNELQRTNTEVDNLEKGRKGSAPDAPFKNNYHEYVLKRLIRMAAEQGYDSIGWTTADIQSERWSDAYAEGYRIEYDQDIPKFLNKYGKKWGTKVGKINIASKDSMRIQESKIESRAFEILSEKGIMQFHWNWSHEYGLAYEQAKNEMAEQGNFVEVWSMPITDSMKESVLYKGQVMYADRYPDYKWHTGMSDAEVSFIERIAKHEVETTENYIDAGNKWLYNDRKDKLYFALYSTAHIDNPTVLYASKGSQATKDYKWLMDFVAEMEMIKNGRDDLRRKTINEVLTTFGYALDKGSLHSGKPTSSRNNRNVRVHRSASGIRPSEALLNCIRNIGEKQERESGLKKSYSDRMEETVYDKMGETERILKENEKLKADIERLKERLKIERQVTHGNYFNANQLDAVAGHLRNISKSNYSKPELVKLLNDVYSYIAHSENLNWDDMFAQCCDIARLMLDESKDITETNDYYKEILDDIRGSKFYVNEGQKGNAKALFGNKWHQAFFGKTNITDNAVMSLDEQWKKWSEAYPEVFDASISDADQLVALYDIYDDVRDASEVVIEYDREEQTRWLAKEIYNQYWRVSTITTTADRYDKQIKRLNFEHRNAMKEFRDDYKERLEKQKLADTIHYTSIIRDIRNRKDKQIAEAKKLGRERLDKYKENAERKTKIQSITSNALTLNKWLVKNSKDEHIHESLKGPVINLLQAIDFSSKRMLDKNIPTQKDISLSSALREVKDMMADASVGKEELVELYGHDMDEDIKEMVKSVDLIMRTVGDNEFVLNQMSLESLETLDKIVKTIKSAVTKMNRFHTVNHAKGIANMSQESMKYLDGLGKDKVFDGIKGKAKKLLNWNNALPYYTFKRYGEGGQKVFEAFQDGWDKFAFHVKKIVDYAKSAYTKDEIKEWSKDIRTFKILEPATDVEREDPNYKPKHQEVQMSIPQIMSLYCLWKRDQARGHILGGGIRIADIKQKSNVISQSEGVILGETDIFNIIGSLTNRQMQVADKLQEFMNTTCSDWGNEVSMLRFGYKAFGEENYFPIQSDKNNLATEDETEKTNSLFRLLNMSFTKSLTDKANNRIVISDIFDVFAQHTSDMAKYNALALPVLDAFKWYNYKEKEMKGVSVFKTHSVKQSMETAFGKDGQNYFTQFLRDLNGDKEVSRDNIGGHFFTNAKIAAVGMNLRVVFLQPTSYVRASAVIDNKYLSAALLHKPKTDKAKKYCGMALWKSMGYYDTDVQRGVAEQIKHDTTWKDKATEVSMWGASKADELTWGYLWNACELEVRRTRQDLKVGSEEFYQTIGKRLREVIYATQVVDSTMTRSQMMRGSTMYDKMLTAFASEPTLAYNMLQDTYMEMRLDGRSQGKKIAFKNHGKKFGRVMLAYTLTNLCAAIVEAGFDAFREDDDEEMDFETFMKMFLTNFANDMSLTAKIPYIKEMHSIIKGFGTSRTDTQWMESIANTLRQWFKIFGGEGNPEKAIKNTLRTVSDVMGLPFYNVYRDFMAALNKLDILTAEELEEMFED